MTSKWLDQKLKYDGSQLRALYAYLDFGILGDSVVAWRGACDVSMEHMVDGEDRLAQAAIRGGDMLHFIVEKFECDLLAAVGLQRLLASLTLTTLQSMSKEDLKALRRDGDDVYWGSKKLSISIATLSRVSALIHFAVNVSNENTPVETCALSDFGVDPQEFARKLLGEFQSEVLSMVRATRKVLPVN